MDPASQDPALQEPEKQTKKKPPPVNMVVHTGYDNAVHPGRLSHVRVVLDNTDKPVEGRLEIRNLRSNTDQVCVTSVELPRMAHKEYSFFLPLEESDSYRVAAAAEVILYEGRRVLARQPVQPRFLGSQVLVLSSTADGAGLQFLNEGRRYNIDIDDRTRFNVAHLSPRDLPRQWPGYEPLDVVALNGRAWGEMDDEQRRAFRIWVEQGGHAIVCGESTTEWRDPEAQALTGVVPQDLASPSTLACLANWGGQPYRARAGGLLTVSGPLSPGSAPLLVEGSRPLVVSRLAGSGRVLWIGFDPFRATLRDWEGFGPFWQKAVHEARRSTVDTDAAELSTQEAARAAASALPRLPAPPMAAVVAFGAVYAFIFGPVNIWMLRRLRRTVRSWLVMPALAVVMTGVVLAVGQSWGSGRSVLNSVSVLEAGTGGRTAVERNLIGVFSPTNRSFDLTFEEPAPALTDLGGADPSEVAASLGWPDRQEDGITRWNALALQLYSTRLMHLQRPRDLGGSVEVSLREQPGGGLAGTVRNGTNLSLTSAYLYRGGRHCWLGELPLGSSANVAAGAWKRGGPTAAAVSGEAGPLESQRFRDAVSKLWQSAPSVLYPVDARRGTWLVAQCADYRGSLEIKDLPYNNRAGLLMVRIR